MPSFIRRSRSLAVCLLLGQSYGFRFGGGINRRLFRLDNAVIETKPASKSAATKGDGEASNIASTGTSNSRTNVPKPKDMPRRFPLGRLRIIGDDTGDNLDDRYDESAADTADVDDELSKDNTAHDKNDEQFQSIVNDMVADIQATDSESPVSGAIEVGDEGGRGGAGKRVTFFASKEATRILSLDEKYTKLLDQYMTLPLEQYSVKSFHDGGPDKVEGRRWFLRRLDEEESLQYMDDEYERRDNHEEYMEDILSKNEANREVITDDDRGRFFRLAVPLKPLIGVELTPVIDLEVIPALKKSQPSSDISEQEEGGSGDPTNAPTSNEDGPSREPRRRPLRAVRRAFSRRGNGRQRGSGNNYGDPGVVRVQSLRVSLLSTEDEVKALMRRRNKAPKPNAKPTQVAQNPSVQQIGNEAIGVVGKIEQAIEPHITFDARITWNTGDFNKDIPEFRGRRRQDSRPSVTVKSTAVTSLTIPPIPTAFRVPLPLPIGVLVRRIGSLLTKRALDITLPRFLSQLERDLERWAQGDGGKER